MVTLTRQPMLSYALTEEESVPVAGQHRKFLQKTTISPEDFETFKHRIRMSGSELMGKIHYHDTPKTLSYPRSTEISRRESTREIPRHHEFPKNLPDNRLVPMARTLRHMQRLGIAAGGQNDERAAQVGRLRLSFHPRDDERHGMPAAKRSRMAMDHLVRHYPDLSFEHYKDDLGNGTHEHHIEIPHNVIPEGIRHIKEWAESFGLVSQITEH